MENRIASSQIRRKIPGVKCHQKHRFAGRFEPQQQGNCESIGKPQGGNPAVAARQFDADIGENTEQKAPDHGSGERVVLQVSG